MAGVRRVLAFTIVDGPDKGTRISTKSTSAVIGRCDTADLRLRDHTCSKEHVTVEVLSDHSGVAMTDHSLHGTVYIKKGQVRPTTVHDDSIIIHAGDQIVIGGTALRLEEDYTLADGSGSSSSGGHGHGGSSVLAASGASSLARTSSISGVGSGAAGEKRASVFVATTASSRASIKPSVASADRSHIASHLKLASKELEAMFGDEDCESGGGLLGGTGRGTSASPVGGSVSPRVRAASTSSAAGAAVVAGGGGGGSGTPACGTGAGSGGGGSPTTPGGVSYTEIALQRARERRARECAASKAAAAAAEAAAAAAAAPPAPAVPAGPRIISLPTARARV